MQPLTRSLHRSANTYHKYYYYYNTLSKTTIKPKVALSDLQQIRTIMDASEAKSESANGVAEWQKRAPYLIHEPNEEFESKYDAECHCGKVKYQLSREQPLDSKLCHCTTCQTQHGEFLNIFSTCMESEPNRTKPNQTISHLSSVR